VGKEFVSVENQTGRIAQFRDFVLFVKQAADEANSLFGRRMFSESKFSSQTDGKKSVG